MQQIDFKQAERRVIAQTFKGAGRSYGMSHMYRKNYGMSHMHRKNYGGNKGVVHWDFIEDKLRNRVSAPYVACGVFLDDVVATKKLGLVSCSKCKAHPRFQKDLQKERGIMPWYPDSSKEEPVDQSKLTVQNATGTFESTGEFRTPNINEWFLLEHPTRGKVVKKATRGNRYPRVIMKKLERKKRPLTEQDLMNWFLGWRKKPLSIECWACTCKGVKYNIHVRTAPFGFNYIGFYHENKGAPLAIMKEGKIKFEPGVEGNVFLLN
jgi:hypothetical protein